MIRRHSANEEAAMPKMMLRTVLLVLALTALAAGSALAAGGPPKGPGARLASITFTCDRAAARLARVEHRIANVQSRIDSGKAKNPERAAKLKQLLEKHAAKIQARIAARC